MKKNLKFTALSAVLLMLAGGLSSCTENNENEPTGIGGVLFAMSVGNDPFLVLDENGHASQQTFCYWHGHDFEAKHGSEIFAINNSEELLNYVHCPNTDIESFFDIDFSKYTLLVARGVSSVGVSFIRASLSLRDDSNYVLSVTIRPQTAQVAQAWAVLFLAPKLSERAETSLEINSTF